MPRCLEFLSISILGILMIGCNTATNFGMPSSDQNPDTTNNLEHTVRGIVLEVTAKSALEIDTLLVQGPKQKEWSFEGKGFAGKTPAHLRRHSLLGQPITVFYQEDEPGNRIVTRITD